MLMAVKRRQEGIESEAMPSEETIPEQIESTEALEEEPEISEIDEEVVDTQPAVQESVLPPPSQDLSDNEIFENVTKLHDEG